MESIILNDANKSPKQELYTNSSHFIKISLKYYIKK